MSGIVRIERALISVSQKMGLVSFAQGLAEQGVEIYSTGGTARALGEAGIAVRDVSDYTGSPEMLGGRVKTLHPKVHGGILARRDVEKDRAALDEHGIVGFDLVVCNLYPFESTIQKEATTVEEAIEQIDIGGPSMIRAAAKNHAWVTVVTDPAQYAEVLEQLRSQGGTTAELRQKLAQQAFGRTARYDRAIVDYFEGLVREEAFPPTLALEFRRREVLRYGENPHQKGALYVEPDFRGAGVATALQLSGKELSYNNLLDVDSALALVRCFSEPAAVVLKHNNPCGAACAENLETAFRRAWDGDPVSAFGSVLGFNRTLDAATAEAVCEPPRFVEVIIAPDFDPAAVEVLTTRPTWKRSVRLLKTGAWDGPDRRAEAAKHEQGAWDLRRVSGGLLVQSADVGEDPRGEWSTVTQTACSEQQLRDLEFAWQVVRQVKSNAIVLAKDRCLVGVGAGQMSRVDSVWLAARKAAERSQGAVLASDAFFPFRDGIDEAAKVGVKAVIQPGGSRRDEEVIAACNEHGIAMIFTGRRHFRH